MLYSGTYIAGTMYSVIHGAPHDSCMRSPQTVIILKCSQSCTVINCDLCQPLKLEGFSLFLDYFDFHPSLVCISERWSKQKTQFPFNKLDGYKEVSIFSRSESLRVGVCILAGYDLPVEPVNVFNDYATAALSCVDVV